jgi:hypothetical protein
MAAMDPLAREMWTLYEPVHAVTYFTPESYAAFEAAGLRGYWRGYFAGRSAALGPVGAAPVVAAFHGFAPAMVSRALPDVWTRATPAATLAAREAGAVASLTRLLDGVDGVAEAASLLFRVAAAVDPSGRVLGAAHAALPAPADPVGLLWHAATVLRECRGDGHFAAMVTADVDGCESLVWRAGIDLAREDLQPYRGWTDDEWSAAVARLASRGWLDDAGVVTAAGLAAHDAVEAATDAAAARPWRALSAGEVQRLRTLLGPVSAACFAAIPPRTPIGLPPR